MKEKIIELLDRYLEFIEERRNEHRNLKLKEDLYQELINCLDTDVDSVIDNRIVVPLLIDLIYHDDTLVNKFYQSLVNIKVDDTKYRQFVEKIKADYQDTLLKIERLSMAIFKNRFLPVSAHKVKNCMLHNLPISSDAYDFMNIKRIFNYFEMQGVINSKEEILLINELELYNRSTMLQSSTDKEKKYFETIHNQIPNMLSAGYQPHDEIEVSLSKQPNLQKMIKEITSFITEVDYDEIIPIIKNYRNYNIEENEYNYVIVKLLDHFLDEILANYELLLEKENYRKSGNRIELTKAYYKILDIYLLLKQYYDEITTYTIDDGKDIEEAPPGKKRLIFSHSDNTVTKTKIISDMKDIPYEYYNRVLELIDGFMTDTLGNKKIKHISRNSEKTSYFELKDDQVRIVFKHIKEDIYCITGVFVKKTNNDMTAYKTMVNRPIPTIDDDKSLEKELTIANHTYDALKGMNTKLSRKGSR